MLNLKSIREAIQSIGNERRQLAREIEEKRERRQWLLTAPMRLEEHLARFDDLIDANAAEFSEKMRALTQGLESKPGQAFHERSIFIAHGDHVGNIQRALCGLFPDAMKAGVRQAAKAWAYPKDSQCGPPMAARHKELDRINEEIADLESKLSDLDTEAAASGVRLDGGAVNTRGDGTTLGSGRRGGQAPTLDQAPVHVDETAADTDD